MKAIRLDEFKKILYVEPPPYVLQSATTFLEHAPSLPRDEVAPSPTPDLRISSSQEDTNEDSRELARRRRLYLQSKPWADFFNARKAKYEKYLEKETPSERTKWLNRERSPPTKSAEVYLWDWSDDDKCKLVRTPIPKRERQETLSKSYLRRHYDSRLNVWEVCRYFDSGAECSGDSDSDSDDGLPCFDPVTLVMTEKNVTGKVGSTSMAMGTEAAAVELIKDATGEVEATQEVEVVMVADSMMETEAAADDVVREVEAIGSEPQAMQKVEVAMAVDLMVETSTAAVEVIEEVVAITSEVQATQGVEAFIAAGSMAKLDMMKEGFQEVEMMEGVEDGEIVDEHVDDAHLSNKSSTLPKVQANPLTTGNVDIAEYLRLYYGFLCPVPLPALGAAVDATGWKLVIRNVGLLSTSPPHPGLSSHIISFLDGLGGKDSKPAVIMWDLKVQSRSPIVQSELHRTIHRIGNFFVVQPPAYQAEHGYKWLITLKTAADAVRAFQIFSVDSHTPQSLSLELLKVGISFRTLHPLPASPSASLSSPPGFVPIRLKDHVFSSVDYLDYVERRRQILISCRGRAALLAGGLLWRLALEHLGEESASFGPSSAVLEHGLGFVCTMQNQVFGDDELTHDEIAVICGLYYQCTGMLIF